MSKEEDKEARQKTYGGDTIDTAWHLRERIKSAEALVKSHTKDREDLARQLETKELLIRRHQQVVEETQEMLEMWLERHPEQKKEG